MKYVLVTGALGGMGRETVGALVKKGYGVITLDLRCEEVEGVALSLATDITNEDSVKCAFERVSEITRELYAIIHFAGMYALDSLVEMSASDFDHIFSVNLRGAFCVNKVFLPLLCKGGRILITTSELANLDPLPFTGIYAITKSALDKYAYSLAMELQLMDIKVSVLRAGAVDTGMLGVSTSALDRFCQNTELYTCNSKRFKSIVERVESRSVKPCRIAQKAIAIVENRSPRFAYSINRNPLLVLLNILPKRIQLRAIKTVLKP